jgi:hypothetical protein
VLPKLSWGERERERERRESSSATLGVGGCFSQKVLCVCLLKKKGEKNKE